MNEKKKFKILIVEDSATFRGFAMQALKGHNNIIAENAIEAVKKFKIEDPDITFLDINLPDGNGIDILKQIKEMNPNAFVVMMTGSNKSNDVEDAQTHGASGYIVKPFNTERVQRSLDEFSAFKKQIVD